MALFTIGADAERQNLLSQLGLLERALATLAMPVTSLRAAWFMDNAAFDLASARDHGVIRSYLQPLDHAVPMIATADVGNAVADLLQQNWNGVRVVELEAAERVSPRATAAAFSKALGKPVKAEAVPREQWEAIFREQGMRNPLPGMQMIDGFNEGWIDFADKGANARKGAISIETAIAALVNAAR
ncbi:NmrA family NAD(P)-binding protein [Bradyrhizobium cenepequi]|uniref:NmrA family NAD(P)-binding protein n=1 Tax=Bradyrhizobium cenepequi TaxID=2821403 RepID=UPI001CE2E1DD|nr:NmrA family NAD(P)-binding protein [Bradyrhizobium cenepequi]